MEHIRPVVKSVSGVELGLTERDYLRGKGFCIERDIAAYKKCFDVITLFHVFEHLDSPLYWLDLFASMLSVDGRLFVEVPNANDALLSLYECDAFADFTYWSAHLYLYTKESLTMLINKSGWFEIEDAGQVQRYTLANHLYWLSKGKPGGQKVWGAIDSEMLNREYYSSLERMNCCDTLFFRLKKRNKV